MDETLLLEPPTGQAGNVTRWNRGLDFSESRLYVLDGGKALHAAVKKHAGDAALIQRCQV
jgi:hypothetical protein